MKDMLEREEFPKIVLKEVIIWKQYSNEINTVPMRIEFCTSYFVKILFYREFFQIYC